QNAVLVEQQMGLYQNDSLTAYIKAVGERLVAGLEENPFTFRFFIADDEMPNAFALPGGYVYVTRGLLPLLNNENELATIMGHEIIHAYRRHAVKQMKKSILPSLLELSGNIIGAVAGAPVGDLINTPIRAGNQLVLAGYSRKYETEADKLGVALAARAGYDPADMNEILTRLSAYIAALSGNEEKRNYFNDHPYTPDRVKRINKQIEKIDWQAGTMIHADLRLMLDNLLYGPDPAKGVFVNNVFIQPETELVVHFPDKWHTLHEEAVVGAAPADQQAAQLITLDTALAPAQSAALFARQFAQKYQTQPVKEGAKTIAGRPGYFLQYKQNSSQGPVSLDLVWFMVNDRHYRLVSVSNTQHQSALETTLQSIHRLTKEEKPLVKQYRLRVVQLRQGEDLNGLSVRSGNILPMKLTLLLNGLTLTSQLQAGKPIKVVVEEKYFK
ncbi:MAG TPA: hypothetical protein ENJ39_02725, partial [Flammeovirgaceae bacterium]|nr:hypothetical protein [Flammeovirgaceae bacterium]